MSISEHEGFCAESEQYYLNDRDAASDRLDWRKALAESRKEIIGFLRESHFLYDVASALEKNGSLSRPMRHLLAPPVSQDQFKLLCPEWSKSTENRGRGFPRSKAEATAHIFNERRSCHLTRWLSFCREPTLEEIKFAVSAIAPLIASQRVATARRNRLSAEQENAVVSLLDRKGWIRKQSSLVSINGELPRRHFMHKTRFSSGANESQEVDIACGLGATMILAMECKVTNDKTNSVKRINDVLKKAHAWKIHWGSFVQPSALLQGVIKFNDVQRLIDNGVAVFWSHRLDIFEDWIDTHLQ